MKIHRDAGKSRQNCQTLRQQHLVPSQVAHRFYQLQIKFDEARQGLEISMAKLSSSQAILRCKVNLWKAFLAASTSDGEQIAFFVNIPQ